MRKAMDYELPAGVLDLDMFRRWLQEQPDTEFNRDGIATLDALAAGKEENLTLLECILEDAEDTDEVLQHRNLLDELKMRIGITW